MANPYPKTYMLLPDYTFKPNQDIQLGTLLLLSKEHKLPDPDMPINPTTRVAVDQNQIRRQSETEWFFLEKVNRVISGGLDAEVPLFSPIAGSASYGRSRSDGIIVNGDTLETQRFVPTEEYLRKTLSDTFVKEYCRQEWFPSVYLVTGTKVIHHAVVEENRDRGQDGQLGLQVDGTGLGVPLKAGPSGELHNSQERQTGSTVEGSFILAYQLKRLRLRKDATVKKIEGYNEHALFDDSSNTEAGTLQWWDLEDVDELTDHLE